MIIQENCIYIQNETEYTSGQEVKEIKTGDIYRCGDYEYKFNYKASLLTDSPWLKKDDYCGWGVRVLDKSKQRYGKILSEINGKPVVSLHNTFYECSEMIESPVIPNTITDLWGTYSGCTNLKSSPIIPQSVRKMQWAFEYCESLQQIPNIPNHITDLSGTFADCRSLINIVLPPQIKTSKDKVFVNIINE